MGAKAVSGGDVDQERPEYIHTSLTRWVSGCFMSQSSHCPICAFVYISSFLKS